MYDVAGMQAGGVRVQLGRLSDDNNARCDPYIVTEHISHALVEIANEDTEATDEILWLDQIREVLWRIVMLHGGHGERHLLLASENIQADRLPWRVQIERGGEIGEPGDNATINGENDVPYLHPSSVRGAGLADVRYDDAPILRQR
jgi:hypothetical protein